MAAAVLFTASAANSEASAQSGPFAPLAGSWSGSGTVTLEDGSAERIRCRAKYAPIGPTLEMSLTCASDAYKFNFSAAARAEGRTITGSWTETSRNISGSLEGRGSNGNYELTVAAASFNARLSLKTSGGRQSVSMRADSQFRGVNISLSH